MNVLLLNPFPAGFDSTQTTLTANGSIQLFGNAVSTGEPINWSSLIDGIGYNEINFMGNGVNGQNTAQTTGFAITAAAGAVPAYCTVTAANNFSAGQSVTFQGNAGTLSAKFNGISFPVLSATSSAFTFNTTITGTTTTGDVGLAYSGRQVSVPVPGNGATLLSTVSALSASGTTLTVTAANTYLPGAKVQVSVATGTLGPKLAGVNLTVLNSTSTAFTAVMPSALTGSTGTGTASGINPPQPYSVKFWSALNSGYIYQYSITTGCLFVLQAPSVTPAGTIAAQTLAIGAGTPATYPVGTAANTGSTTLVATGAVTVTGISTGTFTGAATTAAALSDLAAAAYPAGVLNDVILYEAKFAKG